MTNPARLGLQVRVALRLLVRGGPGSWLGALLFTLGVAPVALLLPTLSATVFYRPPYPELQRLVQISGALQNCPGCLTLLSRSQLEEAGRIAQSFAAFGAYRTFAAVLAGGDEPASVNAAALSGDAFRVLGAQAALGRTLTASDHVGSRASDIPPVVLSQRLWRRRFGSDPSVLSAPVHLGGRAFTVVGIMPPGFDFPGLTDVWVPDSYAPDAVAPDQPAYFGIGRIGSGVTLPVLNARLAGIAAALAMDHPQLGRDWTLQAARVGGSEDRLPGLWLLGGVGVFLLILCGGNFFVLELVRASRRTRGLAAAEAVGCPRGRLLFDAGVDAAIRTCLGGVAGTALAAAAARALSVQLTQELHRIIDIRPAPWHWLAGAALAAVAGGLCGIAAAGVATRGPLGTRLREGSAFTGGRTGSLLRQVAIAAQVALTVVVLGASGVLMKSYLYLQRRPLGYDPDRLAVAQVTFGQKHPDPAPRLRLALPGIVARLAAVPGAKGVAVWQFRAPAAKAGAGEEIIVLDDRSRRLKDDCLSPATCEIPPFAYHITAGSFQALGMRLSAGRAFTGADRTGAEPVAIITERAARAWWPGESAVGRKFKIGSLGSGGPWLTVVGVAANIQPLGAAGMIAARNGSIYPIIFRPLEQTLAEPDRPCAFTDCAQTTFAVRTTDPVDMHAVRALGNVLRETLRDVFADAVPEGVGSLRELQLRNPAIARIRVRMSVLALIAIFGLLLSSVGIYGTVANAQRARAREFAVRIALGALPGHMVRLSASSGLALGAVGALVGLFATYIFSEFWARIFFDGPAEPGRGIGMVFGTTATDVRVLGPAALLLASLVALASFLPARAAARTDPSATLRAE